MSDKTIDDLKAYIEELEEQVEQLTEELDDFRTAASDAYDCLKKVI